jgi:hypothetical protein
MIMKSAFVAVIVMAGATMAGTSANAQTAGNALRPCTARVVHSEALPFAPIGSWLIKVTLEVTPKNGAPYYTSLESRMPWPAPPPRRGRAFCIWCDPANPNVLRFASRPISASSL